MNEKTIVTLKKGEGRAFKAGGLWIYDNEIESIHGTFKNGAVVTVQEQNGCPLGRGFNLKEDANYILVGGGLGVPPLIYAAQKLAEHDASFATAVFGYRNDHFAEEYVSRYADWSWSIDDAEGNVVDLLNKLEQGDDLKAYDRKPIILSCGPLPMMKAVADWAAERGIPAQLSMEQRMGCGYGTCVLCTIDTVDGRLKVCSDGPVFTREQLGWGK